MQLAGGDMLGSFWGWLARIGPRLWVASVATELATSSVT